MEVTVVTSTELGWNCVVGVFVGLTEEQLRKAFPGRYYVFTEKTVDTNTHLWEEPDVVDVIEDD